MANQSHFLTEDTLICGDAREVLTRIPAGMFQTCITSPPYWGLRDYGLEPIVWGGDPLCQHEWDKDIPARKNRWDLEIKDGESKQATNKSSAYDATPSQFCTKCGAWLGSLGLEPAPELYIDHLVQIFREVKRVLRDDGTAWINIGDSYWSGNVRHHTIKPKDMVMIPFRLALALQEPYEDHVIQDEKWRMWLAAVIDTDGCIGIRKQACSGKKGRDWNDTYIPYLTVSMSDTQIIEKCIEITKYGKINVKQRAGTTDNRGINSRYDYFTWRLDGNKAVKLLRDIWPYLLIKQRQALSICTLDDSNKNSRTGRYQGKVPPKEMKKRESLYALTKALNQREQVDFPSWIQRPKVHIEPGWYVRSDIIWAKLNPMPESVRDRPTKSHEYVFLLAKSKKCYYDQDAIREPYTEPLNRWGGPAIKQETEKHSKYLDMQNVGASSVMRAGREMRPNDAGRNKRTVWTIPTTPFPGAHFATFPTKLIEPMILAGSAEKACEHCGAPWTRVVEKGNAAHTGTTDTQYKTGTAANRLALLRQAARESGGEYVNTSKTLRFEPSCNCENNTGSGASIVLDCFAGSGTTCAVAKGHRRHYVGIEANPEYIKLAEVRIADIQPYML